MTVHKNVASQFRWNGRVDWVRMTIQLTTLPRDEMERAFHQRDSSYDGLFFYAVRTTGIFCRPAPSRLRHQ